MEKESLFVVYENAAGLTIARLISAKPALRSLFTLTALLAIECLDVPAVFGVPIVTQIVMGRVCACDAGAI